MARKNVVIVTGIVSSVLELKKQIDGTVVGRFRLTIGRNGFPGSDRPMIEVGGEALNFMKQIQVGSYLHIEGELHTRIIQYRKECPACHSVVEKDILATTIYTEKIIPFALSETSFHQNNVFLLGHVVRKPAVFQTKRGIPKTKYQMVIKRHIGAKTTGLESDYPYVVSYKRLGQQDALRIMEGSMIFVQGAIQSVEKEIPVVCSVCSFTQTPKVNLVEIVCKSTEYLHGCNFPENEDPNHWEVLKIQRQLRV